MITLSQFNGLPAPEALCMIRHCVAIPDWPKRLVALRPYASLENLLEMGNRLSQLWGKPELLQALTAHPRIGERPPGQSVENRASRTEQASVLLADDPIKQAIAEANRAYEQRFGYVFLIRAKGRSPEQILSCLTRRLSAEPAAETEQALQQLREITRLRLEEIFQ